MHGVRSQFSLHPSYFFNFAINENQRQVKHFLFLLLIMEVLYSCKKYPGPSQPVATLTSPSDTAIINAGDTILLKGTVSDNKSLHEVFFRLSDSANDSILFFDNPYTHGAQARNFSYTWITSLPGAYKWIVEIQDHDRHTTIQEFPIVVH